MRFGEEREQREYSLTSLLIYDQVIHDMVKITKTITISFTINIRIERLLFAKLDIKDNHTSPPN